MVENIMKEIDEKLYVEVRHNICFRSFMCGKLECEFHEGCIRIL